ncbi:4-hydroxythreonine-4-phosphate dehydrogenase [Pikeienuella piscinae]|uniref:4-hydroxythreonine-4-phosphate dehydrogenase n=1 Tax=Pikeienuella piscinae TaxID=2748098 RepID=A0A7L5C2Z3_9RHOB|nr:4-hydroxythreonine-4-phosphate dehydrogenase PdxA [Pikeienuella piscinae]QIE56624.1 4-hydroxythreonine-4-phosphate dehydrogenase [Pikeienuella piscinae]
MRIAFALGDAAGVSPELAAKILADRAIEAGEMVVIGDARVLERGCAHAGVELKLPRVTVDELRDRPDRTVLLDMANCDPDDVPLGVASEPSGRGSVQNFRMALEIANAGIADMVFFTPFNKHAMRLAQPDYVDEIGFIDRTIGAAASGREFNVLDEVWNARVTSHIPLRDVAETLSVDRIYDSIKLTFQVMKNAGFDRPRIGVAALNPHAGDGGNFGAEDDEIIAPAVARAQGEQMPVTGPVPSDTVFLRAVKGEFDAVLTMFHDQGQIAMKLLGFDRGVTLIAGYPFPIVTPAHGTAYDIAGLGKANAGAAIKAVELGRELVAKKGLANSGPRVVHPSGRGVSSHLTRP